MPALFALGLQNTIASAQARLPNGDRIFVFLGDIYLITTKARARTSIVIITQAVQNEAGTQTIFGKLHAWCRGGGEAPADLAALGPEVWTADRPSIQNGLVILEAPLGHPEFVADHANKRLAEENRLLHKLPDLPDLQSAWALLFYSAVPRANHLLRVPPPPSPSIMPLHATPQSGKPSAPSSAPRTDSTTRKRSPWRPSPPVWEALASATPAAPPLLPTGPLGPMLSR